jgi:hypothetical protein
VVDLSHYIEYKNQEYFLTIVDTAFNFEMTPDIIVKIMKKGGEAEDIFDGFDL